MKAQAKSLSLSGWRKDNAISLPAKEFARLNFWFDSGDRAIDARLSGQLKEIYTIIFCDEKDDQLVNFSDLALTWCCWKKEESPTGARTPVGLLRALTVAETVEGTAIVPAGREGRCGPVVTANQLEWLLAADSGGAALAAAPAAIFAEARRLEGGSEDSNTTGIEDQTAVVSFSSLCDCKSFAGASDTLFVLEDLFGFM